MRRRRFPYRLRRKASGRACCVSAGLERLILYLNTTLVLGLGALPFGRRVSRGQLVALGEPFTGWMAAGPALVWAGVWMLAKWR